MPTERKRKRGTQARTRETAAAKRLQRWWRSLKRNAPCNEVCVISLEKVPRERRFVIILGGGCVYQYCSNSLYVYLHSNLTTEEPVCRHNLSAPELRRLDKLVDKAMFGANGPSENIRQRGQERCNMRAHESAVDYMEDDLRARLNFAVASIESVGVHVHPVYRIQQFKVQADVVWEHLIAMYAFDSRACMAAALRYKKELAMGGSVAMFARESLTAVISQFERVARSDP